MAINYGANYTGIDKERYDAGNQFYSQDRFPDFNNSIYLFIA